MTNFRNLYASVTEFQKDRQTDGQTGSAITTVQPKRHKHNPRLRHGQIISPRRPNRVFTRRIAVALGIDPGNDAESVLTSRTFAE
ncbi:hypothetical protein DPMN_003575 [Dreissena polymorpha]|uniref:Uncharacterized protein n=1 Tax=Dreissena polymorpha TaxID=45954 RepID=A0A9D4MPY7_DREPO|nr:hypothetical protein DPMN_003575 [Dreissena polymorpha]